MGLLYHVDRKLTIPEPHTISTCLYLILDWSEFRCFWSTPVKPYLGGWGSQKKNRFICHLPGGDGNISRHGSVTVWPTIHTTVYYVTENGGNCQTKFLSESCAKLLLCLFTGESERSILFIYLQSYLKAKSNNVFGRFLKPCLL